MAQVTGAPSVDYGISKVKRCKLTEISTAAIILSMVSLSNPDYNVENYQISLLTSPIMIIHGFISSMPTLSIARFNSIGTITNIIFLFIVTIIIPAPKINYPKFNESAGVWGTIGNGTDWQHGIAALMFSVAVIWTMSGNDTPFHLSEESSDVNIASARVIVMTSAVGGIMRWVLQLVIAYTVIDICGILSVSQSRARYCFQVLNFTGGYRCFHDHLSCIHDGTWVYDCGFPSHVRLCPRRMFPAFEIPFPDQ